MADYHFLPVPYIPQHYLPSSPSLSRIFTDQWTATASTLTVGSLAPIPPRAIGYPGVTDSSETAALKLRVSQLEAALEELRCRVDALTKGEQGLLKTSPVYGPC